MMSSMIKEEFVVILDNVDSWQESIKCVFDPLLKAQCIDERYVQNVFEKIELYGAYHVIAPNIALPHGDFQCGVLKKSMAVLLLRKPIKFSDDSYDVKLLVGFAPIDASSHLETLTHLSNLLSDEEQLQKILQASSTKELYNFFKHL